MNARVNQTAEKTKREILDLREKLAERYRQQHDTKPTRLDTALREIYEISVAEFAAALVEELEERRAAGEDVTSDDVGALLDHHFAVLGLTE